MDIQRHKSFSKRWMLGISNKIRSHMGHSSMFVHHMDWKKKQGRYLGKCKGQEWHPTSSTTVHCLILLHAKASMLTQKKFYVKFKLQASLPIWYTNFLFLSIYVYMYGGRIFGCGPFSFSLISAPSLVSSLIDKKLCLFLQSQVVYNSLINAYANSKQPDKARKIFEDVQTAGLQPDMVSSCP